MPPNRTIDPLATNYYTTSEQKDLLPCIAAVPSQREVIVTGGAQAHLHVGTTLVLLVDAQLVVDPAVKRDPIAVLCTAFSAYYYLRVVDVRATSALCEVLVPPGRVDVFHGTAGDFTGFPVFRAEAFSSYEPRALPATLLLDGGLENPEIREIVALLRTARAIQMNHAADGAPDDSLVRRHPQ